jgi:threonine dehydratase
MICFDDIQAAAERIAPHAPPTPAEHSRRLSGLAGCEIYLKLENQQHTGSFKERGAINKLALLTPEEARRGVVAMSAGNHAQAVAYHAARTGVAAVVVMPRGTPFTKIERTESLGGKVLLEGDNLAEAQTFAESLAARDGLTFVHPYDDPAIIAGQGTTALEFLRQFPDLDDLVVPIGGGGLTAGCAVAAQTLTPNLRLTGVETAAYPSMKQLLAGEAITCGGVTLAEGIAVKNPGALTAAILKDRLDHIALLGESRLEQAVFMLATVQKLVAEGAGAAGLAAVLADPERWRGRKVGLIVSGGNIDARLMAQVLMRGLVADGRIVRLRIALDDRPGALAKVTALLGAGGADIVEIYHQRLFHDVPVKMAEIDVIIETRDRRHVQHIIDTLSAAGFAADLMADVS